MLASAVLMGCKGKTADTPDANAPVTKSDATTETPKPADAKADATAEGDLAGDWTAEGQDGGGTYTFGSDGTFSSVLEKDKVKSEMKGTYEVKGADLTLVLKSMDITTTDPKQEDMVKEANKMVQAGLNKPAPGTIKWKSKDEAEMTVGGQTTTLKRK